MVSNFTSLLDIQSWWEIPCISHFCSLFSSAFDLPDIDIEDLETALLSDGTDDQIVLLSDLIVRLLRGCEGLKKVASEITQSNYQMFLRRFLREQCRLHEIENFFDSDVDFHNIPVRNQLQVLHDLCHFRLEALDVPDILNNLEADTLRVEPLGFDCKKSSYWYFYGTRLYREDKPIAAKASCSKGKLAFGPPAGGVWQVICFTEEDWQNLTSKFKGSSNSDERALHQILEENFLPRIPALFRERERLRRRKVLQPRNSSRIRSIIEIKERQEQQKQEEKHQRLEKERIEREAEREAERLKRQEEQRQREIGFYLTKQIHHQTRARRRLARDIKDLLENTNQTQQEQEPTTTTTPNATEQNLN